MAQIAFQGWKRDYQIVNPAAYQEAILEVLCKGKVSINDVIHEGDSLTQVVFHLRYKNFVIPSLAVDQETLLKVLGFFVRKGKVGKWTSKDYKFCQPATVVTL